MTKRQLFALLATIIGSGIVIVDGTVVNLALPSIAHNLHANFADLQWIIDGYLLSLSALILLGGSLGDIFGRKRIYLLGLAGFGISSLLCGLAPNLRALIVLRVVQGTFGALLVPGALSIINTNFPKAIRGLAFGRWTAWSGILTVLGPLLGGYLIEVASWRWIFFINVPLVVICYIFAFKNVDESRDRAGRHIDYTGALLAALALAGVTYGLIEGPATHWSVKTLLTLVGAGLIGGIFLYVERRERDPMLRLELFRNRNFSGVNATTFAMYGGLSGFIFAILIYLQQGLHYSSLKAGFSLLPISLIMLFLASRMGALSAKYGSRLFMTFGPLISAIGIFYLVRLHPGDSYIFGVFPGVFIFALGLATTVAPLTVTVMSSVPEASSGLASGINNAVTRVAGLIVIAVLGIFGAGQAYRFTILLCGTLLALAGILSYLVIRNPSKA